MLQSSEILRLKATVALKDGKKVFNFSSSSVLFTEKKTFLTFKIAIFNILQVLVQGVRDTYDCYPQGLTETGENPAVILVLIGTNLNKEFLQAELEKYIS